ncbi:MAG: ATPase domain-containing protein [Candidatus Woesearchaeota archaeon]
MTGKKKGFFSRIFSKSKDNNKEGQKAEPEQEEDHKKAFQPEDDHQKEEEVTFTKTGVPGFDSLTEQGVPEGSAILVEGGPGSGKTIFCLTTAFNACKQGKKVLYMSFEEPEHRLRSHMKNFGWDPSEYEKKNQLMIKRFNALDIARSVEALLSEAKKELLIEVQPILIPKDFDPDIVLVDSLSSIASAFSGEESRFRVYMEQLFRYLESHQMTSFLIRETASPTHIGRTFVEKGEAVSFLSDGIIAIYNVIRDTGKRERALEIIKMRGTDIKRNIVKAEVSKGKGFIVYPDEYVKGSYRLT